MLRVQHTHGITEFKRKPSRPKRRDNSRLQSNTMAEKKRVHLFNCDKTYDLLVVDALLRAIQDKLPFNFTVSKHYFSLHDMSNICDNTISKLHIDFAFLVVHANESRLSINERNVDIGYTRVYRALLDAAGKPYLYCHGGSDCH